MGRLLAQCFPYISLRSPPFAIILFAMDSHRKLALNDTNFSVLLRDLACEFAENGMYRNSEIFLRRLFVTYHTDASKEKRKSLTATLHH